MSTFLQDVDRRRAQWRPGKLERRGTADFDCAVADETATSDVNCIYANYLEARYPKGRFLVREKFEPVLLMVDGKVQAVLMPLKL